MRRCSWAINAGVTDSHKEFATRSRAVLTGLLQLYCSTSITQQYLQQISVLTTLLCGASLFFSHHIPASHRLGACSRLQPLWAVINLKPLHTCDEWTQGELQGSQSACFFLFHKPNARHCKSNICRDSHEWFWKLFVSQTFFLFCTSFIPVF